jgi:hypothetical protein
MKSAPAARLSQIGGTARLSASPASTAIADVATRASAEPAKTTQRDEPPAASDSVASWVLSPISARNMAAKVDAKSFQSIGRSFYLTSATRAKGKRARPPFKPCVPNRGDDGWLWGLNRGPERSFGRRHTDSVRRARLIDACGGAGSWEEVGADRLRARLWW